MAVAIAAVPVILVWSPVFVPLCPTRYVWLIAVPCQVPLFIVPTVVIANPLISDLVWSAVAPSSTLSISRTSVFDNAFTSPLSASVLPIIVLVATSWYLAWVTLLFGMTAAAVEFAAPLKLTSQAMSPVAAIFLELVRVAALPSVFWFN